MTIQVVKSIQMVHLQIEEALKSSEPYFLGRAGGSDTNAVVFCKDNKSKDVLEIHRANVEKYNGFYDLEPGWAGFYDYLDTLDYAHLSCDAFFAVTPAYLTPYFPELCGKYLITQQHIVEKYRSYLEMRMASQKNTPIYAYNFVETLNAASHTLFKLFSESLNGKKVLVVSPFSETIKAQRPLRDKFFKNYTYPDFELLCYNTPITYSGLPPEFYPDQNWARTLSRMKKEIEKEQFDIALISSGSYSMPLGAFVKDWMGKQAIYVGGFLQVFFGVFGRRWDNQFYLPQINFEHFSRPTEGERYMPNVSVKKDDPTEGFGAYF